jgi:hypothetical protein
MLIGWSLINSVVQTEHYLLMQDRIKDFKQIGFFDMGQRIAIGQKFIEPDYRGKGIVESMTVMLDCAVSSKFDVYMATVKKENRRSEFFSKKNSYELFFEDEKRLYFRKDIGSSSPIMESSILLENSDDKVEIVVRPGEQGDEFALHQLNRAWTYDSRVEDASQGFLTSLYSPDDFRLIIDAGEIVVAEVIT